MSQDVSEDRAGALTDSTVSGPTIAGDRQEPPPGYGAANHPPGNQGPQLPAVRLSGRNSRIPGPAVGVDNAPPKSVRAESQIFV